MEARDSIADAYREVLHERILGVIDRNRQRLQSSEARLAQGLAALRLSEAHAERGHAEVERRLAAQRAAPPQPPSDGSTRSSAMREAEELRQICAEVAMKVAETEENIAHGHDRLASRRPEKAEQYGETARLARAQAKRAREIASHFEHLGAADRTGPAYSIASTQSARQAGGSDFSV